jgi:hypothetical protein
VFSEKSASEPPQQDHGIVGPGEVDASRKEQVHCHKNRSHPQWKYQWLFSDMGEIAAQGDGW